MRSLKDSCFLSQREAGDRRQLPTLQQQRSHIRLLRRLAYHDVPPAIAPGKALRSVRHLRHRETMASRHEKPHRDEYGAQNVDQHIHSHIRNELLGIIGKTIGADECGDRNRGGDQTDQ